MYDSWSPDELNRFIVTTGLNNLASASSSEDVFKLTVVLILGNLTNVQTFTNMPAMQYKQDIISHLYIFLSKIVLRSSRVIFGVILCYIDFTYSILVIQFALFFHFAFIQCSNVLLES